jgi:hypothetical protein
MKREKVLPGGAGVPAVIVIVPPGLVPGTGKTPAGVVAITLPLATYTVFGFRPRR